jgi:uroporphyrinogen-III synthase
MGFRMKIAVTKLKEKSEGIYELFASYGHEAIIISTMQVSSPTDTGQFLHLCDMVSRNKIDILIFTSALGVEKLFERIKPGENVRIVSVGPKTANKIRSFGFSSEIIANFSSANFADHFGSIEGKTIGIARAQVPDVQLTDSLTAKGAIVVDASAYRLEPAGKDIRDILRGMDAVIFTSARSFEYSGFSRDYTNKLKIIAIGHRTAEAMQKNGIIPDFVGNGTLENCLEFVSLKRVADTCKQC